MTVHRSTAGRRPHAGWLAPLALALLGARALVPAGFMLAPHGGAIEMRFCGGTAHGHEHAAPHALVDPSCPFAQSAGPAPLPFLAPAPAAPAPGADWPVPAPSQIHAGAGPPREPAARGPPPAA